jgi:molybdate-binding protein
LHSNADERRTLLLNAAEVADDFRVSNEPTLHDAVLAHLCSRDQGLLVAAGNPLGIASINDLRAGSCAWLCVLKSRSRGNLSWAC